MRRLLPLLAACSLAFGAACSSSSGGAWKPGDPLTLDVSNTFPAGTALRDQYSGKTASVGANGSVTVTPDPRGVVLLERDGAPPTPFTWQNATVYFALTDRFFNGNPANDHSYGTRPADNNGEIGTWHGGDFAGLTQKLDYIAGLGATAIWISPIVEQVHGWVSGGGGAWKHYAYAGYWALDFTRLDQNFGSEAELQALVDGAHQRGLRVLVDVVMNHPGYATGDDLLLYLPEVIDANGFRNFQPPAGRGYDAWNDLVNYKSPAWVNWWSPKWIRAGFPGFDPGGLDDLTSQLSFLPDFKTESTAAADFPVLLQRRKSDTHAVADLNASVRQYLVKWHSDWVRKFGIDGFRCDTAKNVELGSWKALKAASAAALLDWKAAGAGASTKLDDAPFWMTGEVYGHGATKDAYFTDGGFDSLINFDFQNTLVTLLHDNPTLVAGATGLEGLYSDLSAKISADPGFDTLSYLSSHDTDLFFGYVQYDAAKQRQAGTALLLAPGSAQIFYGDESGRQRGNTQSDRVQGTRSDMNWDTADGSISDHWMKLAQFRKRHAAVGAGVHHQIVSPAGTYAFSRKLGTGDAVVVAITSGN